MVHSLAMSVKRAHGLQEGVHLPRVESSLQARLTQTHVQLTSYIFEGEVDVSIISNTCAARGYPLPLTRTHCHIQESISYELKLQAA